MNAKQNIVFFIGLILIVMVFWMHGYWAILKQGVFSGSSNNTPPEGIVKPNKNGQCPKGYKKFGGVCIPPVAGRIAAG